MPEPVTVVLVSCCRPDLLAVTLDSFLANNTYPIAEFVFIDDGQDKAVQQAVLNKYRHVFSKVIIEGHHGLLWSVDRAYKEVKTEFVFHCEDDWAFYNSGGFIEESLSILRCRQDVGEVWVRLDDMPHPPERELLLTPDSVQYRLVQANWNGWHGFSFNPGLRRMSDQRRLMPFFQYHNEKDVDEAYFRLGLRTATLTKSRIKHIGGNRHLDSLFDKVL